ncbi:MAG TPA: hypothetical protein VMT52_12805 [Planctomycetota bacterium]|nr:hypothetical protein [Planctomycetota bacterium]
MPGEETKPPSPRDPAGSPEGASLLREGAILSRYLLGEETEREVLDRYARACHSVFTGQPSRRDAAILAFISRHPRSLPFLDAAAGLVDPGSLLRRKLLVMISIVETTPLHAPFFVERPSSRAALILRVALLGVGGLLKGILGLPLHALLRRAR